jgi:UDP-2-acetamido-2,6-beta-L-arabino-hexul-4-ose reductase
MASAEHEVVPVDRVAWSKPEILSAQVLGTDAVIHCAGVTRSDNPADIDQNVSLAEELTRALDRNGCRPTIVYADSIQAGNSTPFGQAKLRAAQLLTEWGEHVGAPIADVRLPNLFGERGRPHYNSVVATFSFLLATGGKPQIIEDRVVSLLHAQDAVDFMLDVALRRAGGTFQPDGRPTQVSRLLEKLQLFSRLYGAHEIPELGDGFDRALFNTYRSYCFPDKYPMYADIKSDARGALFECFRVRGGQTHVFCSTTKPGTTRGNHFHLRKIERFMVIDGHATISIRRLFDEAIVRFPVAGERPSAVDMPTMHTHSIVNTGSRELTTLFWADEIPTLGSTDTYPESVELNRSAT